MTTIIKAEDMDKDYSREQLLTHYVNQGATIYTIVRSVSASGMSRTMSFKVIKDGELCDVTYYVAGLLDYSLNDYHGHNTIRVSGCGMDMAFHVVSGVATVLFNDYKALRSEII
jgi:hypothetical protein